jgi:antitoxin component YwqK of YwqJK toxin-antitoxin module
LIEKYVEPSEIKIQNNGVITERWLDRNYNLHSFMGQPAYIEYYNWRIERQIWYKKGFVHRDRDLPSYVEYNNGKISCKIWHKKGTLHRDGDLPAIIDCDSNGQIRFQYWYKNGDRNREGGLPAYVQYKNRKTICKEWYKNGKLIKQKNY